MSDGLFTTAKHQVAHVEGCEMLGRAERNGNKFPIATAEAEAHLLPCTRCLPRGVWPRFRRWAT